VTTAGGAGPCQLRAELVDVDLQLGDRGVGDLGRPELLKTRQAPASGLGGPPAAVVLPSVDGPPE
jgi:hypothetical protein